MLILAHEACFSLTVFCSLYLKITCEKNTRSKIMTPPSGHVFCLHRTSTRKHFNSSSRLEFLELTRSLYSRTDFLLVHPGSEDVSALKRGEVSGSLSWTKCWAYPVCSLLPCSPGGHQNHGPFWKLFLSDWQMPLDQCDVPHGLSPPDFGLLLDPC